MSLYKRGKWYHMDDVVNEVRYRLPLKTTNWQKAKGLEKEKLNEIAEGKLGSVGKVARQGFNAALAAYLEERKLHGAESTYTTECYVGRSLSRFFGDIPLRKITLELIVKYQSERRVAGLSGRAINMQIGLLRRILKRNKQWGRLADDVRMLPQKPKPARVLSPDEKARLLDVAAIRPDWQIAHCASVLALSTTMRGCELKGLCWKDVDLFEKILAIRRESTKTNAGARIIPLNRDAIEALVMLKDRAEKLGSGDPDHYVFPACESFRVDPTRPMKGWRTAWLSLTKAAGLRGLRFHDLRHQAITELCENGLSDMTIMGIAGHVSMEMLQHYSHIRLEAKRKVLDGLEMHTHAIDAPAESQPMQRPN